MTYTGKLYFYMCHMLYTIMQICYEIQETTTDTEIQAYHKWNTAYHALMGWCLEEIVFPLTFEQVKQEEGKIAGEAAEMASESLYTYTYNSLLNSVDRLQVPCQTVLGKLLYYQYCSLLSRVLSAFGTLIDSNFQSTPYSEHYREKANLFEDLIEILASEYSNAPFNCISDIEAKSDELERAWSNRLFAVITNNSQQN